ncbi:MAG TPA: chromate resistance protein ChrB domain-containing protein [Myxococcales bacterium]|nr:chromate resistance protein ChrB domain-containing protein [Myxococcales bacterium]
MAESEKSAREPGWLLLIHQIPPRPNYFRVKIWRRLQKLGAIAIKNSVYALPAGEQAQEDLNWILREIVEGGGDASLVEARLVEGLDDEQVREMFRAARDADYQAVAEEVRKAARGLPRKGEMSEEKRAELSAALAKLHKRLGEIAAIDFFHARSREAVDGLLRELEEKAAARAPAGPEADSLPPQRPRGATWVTRTGIHVDRMASAWLIRRFIDPQAKFRFVAAREHRHQSGELRFDMFDGEFTHQGELCSFEVLLARFEIADPALRAIAEIVHDIDLKDEKYGRADNAGFEHLVNGIALAHPEDEARLERACAVLDDLYEYFRRKRRGGEA